MEKIQGLEISQHHLSDRIVFITIKKEILEKLKEPFKRFDLTALEYKPFTRFTIANMLNEITSNKLNTLINKIIRDRNTGCFIISPKKFSTKVDSILCFNPYRVKVSNFI